MKDDTDSMPAPPADPVPGSGTRWGAVVLATLIVTSLVLYVVGDRLTPSTSQARVQAFVVPVAAEVAGKVVKVHVRDNDEVQPAQALFDIDPQPYEIAQQSARAAYETARQSVDAGHAGVEGARAALKVAEANRDLAESDAVRQERLYKEDPGAISVRRLEMAQATREEARSKVRGAEAEDGGSETGRRTPDDLRRAEVHCAIRTECREIIRTRAKVDTARPGVLRSTERTRQVSIRQL